MTRPAVKTSRDDVCKDCGLPRHEHHHDGKAYGVCGQFSEVSRAMTPRTTEPGLLADELAQFPFRLDLRKHALAGDGMQVIDADSRLVLMIYPDELGRYDHAAPIVDALNDALRTPPAGNDVGSVELASFGHAQKPFWILKFEDADRGEMHFGNEEDAHRAFESHSVTWNCTLFETAARKYDLKCGQLIALRAVPPAGSVGVRAKIETEARRYAEMYEPHSDGRNTFVIFADWVAALGTILDRLRDFDAAHTARDTSAYASPPVSDASREALEWALEALTTNCSPSTTLGAINLIKRALSPSDKTGGGQ
jgi:hypothetical protein